jgi:urate oxidase
VKKLVGGGSSQNIECQKICDPTTNAQDSMDFTKDITAKADYAPIFENCHENLLSLVSETPPPPIKQLLYPQANQILNIFSNMNNLYLFLRTFLYLFLYLFGS